MKNTDTKTLVCEIHLAGDGAKNVADIRQLLQDRLTATLNDLLAEQGLSVADLSVEQKDEEVMTIGWTVNDVQDNVPDLFIGEAWDVLNYVVRNHDASLGINHDTFIEAAGRLYPEPRTLEIALLADTDDEGTIRVGKGILNLRSGEIKVMDRNRDDWGFNAIEALGLTYDCVEGDEVEVEDLKSIMCGLSISE